jgi:hypothetical protein
MKITKKDLRTFAYIWTFIFFIIGIYPLYKSGLSALLTVDSLAALKSLDVRSWSLYVSLGFFLVGTFIPKILSGFYKVWVKFGELIGGVISKIILLILFYGLFTPISLVLKILRKDLLHKKLDKKSQSYWLKRTMQPGSLKKQF